jgi:hypothetical protein
MQNLSKYHMYNFMVYGGKTNILAVASIRLHLQGRRVKSQDKQSGIKQ